MFKGLINSVRRCRATVVFHFDGTHVTAPKGKFATAAQRELVGVLSNQGIRSGEIHIVGNGRIEIERDIPERFHQQVRNVISVYL